MKEKFEKKAETFKANMARLDAEIKFKADKTWHWFKENVTIEDIVKCGAAIGLVVKTTNQVGKIIDENRSRNMYYDRSVGTYVKKRRDPNARELDMIRQMHEEGYTYSECYRMLGLIK